jgi:hypothetical protein
MAKAKTQKKVVSKKAGGNKSRAAKVVPKTKGLKLESLGASSRVYSHELFGNTSVS